MTLYGRPCPKCGAPMNPSDPGESRQCFACYLVEHHEQRHWTPERIVAWLQEHAIDGVPISASEARHVPNMAIREFGSWNAAVAAAGLPIRPAGHRKVPVAS